MAVAQISDQDIVKIAEQYSVPPSLLAGVVSASGSSGTLGMSDATLMAFGMSAGQAQADPMLALAIAARVLSQSFQQTNSWQEALSTFLTGDPQAYQSPTSAVGGQVEAILGAAAVNPTMGLDGFRPADARLFTSMAGALTTQLQGMTSTGGALSQQRLQQYQQQVDAVAATAHGTTTYTPDPQLQQMAADVLSKMSDIAGTQYPATPANLALITTMARGEGMPAQDFNWLASTQGQGVGTVPGTPGVNVYGSYDQGIEQTARTFLNGNFNSLLGQMRSGADLQTMARNPGVQANLRTWQGGSSEDVNLLLGQRNVGGTGAALGGTTIAQGLQAAAQNNAQSYSPGECTYYAARSLGFIPGGLGNAEDWASRASGMGMQVDSTPAVGTAVVYGPTGPYSPQYGHVAVVKQVNQDGTFVVSEMNVDGQGVVDERTSTMNGVIGFIHPPAGTNMQQAAPGLAQQVAATSSSTPQQQARQQAAQVATGGGNTAAAQRQRDREPAPVKVGEFASQLQAAGIPPQDFVQHFPTVAAAIRRDLGDAAPKTVDVSDFATAYKGVQEQQQPITQANLVAQVRSQPHPTYPSVSIGQVSDARNAAALHSITHTLKLPTTAEAARLAASNAGWREMQSYYQEKAAQLAALQNRPGGQRAPQQSMAPPPPQQQQQQQQPQPASAAPAGISDQAAAARQRAVDRG